MKLFVDDLTVIDSSFLCPQRGIVGESWITDICLDGSLNDESMIQDFGLVKKQIKQLIDQHVDHKLLVPVEHPNLVLNQKCDDGRQMIAMNTARGALYLCCPPDAFAFVYDCAITPQTVTGYLLDILAAEAPDNVDGIELILRTEAIVGPFFHYSHGLKKHDGNCQRIAHGHRSPIHILIDDKRSREIEQFWANRWEDIYIGSEEDRVMLADLSLTNAQAASLGIDSAHYHFFAYDASQGRFELAIAGQHTDLIATDSTVECLAQHVLDVTNTMYPSSSILVKAFEGVGKGAIATNSKG